MCIREMIFMNKIARNIKFYRKKNKISQKELANILKVGQTAISNYESGRRMPNYELILKLSNVFGVSMDEMTSNDDFSLDNSEINFDEMKNNLVNLLINNDEKGASDLVLNNNYNDNYLIELYEKVIKEVLYDIGEMWADGSISVAKEHYMSNILLNIVIALSRKRDSKTKISESNILALCMSCSSDFHTIGIKLIEDFLRIMGINTIYIGSNTPTESIVDIIIENKINLIAISVTIEDHIPGLIKFIDDIRSNKQLGFVKIIVGGQGMKAVNNDYLQVGADGYAYHFKSLEKELDRIFKQK